SCPSRVYPRFTTRSQPSCLLVVVLRSLCATVTDISTVVNRRRHLRHSRRRRINFVIGCRRLSTTREDEPHSGHGDPLTCFPSLRWGGACPSRVLCRRNWEGTTVVVPKSPPNKGL